MSRDHDELARRPERVIILDADDPMTEIHGRFVWQEEHDRVVDEVRRQAYAEGYEAGRAEALAASPAPITYRRRRGLTDHARLAVLVLLGLLVLLMLPVIFL